MKSGSAGLLAVVIAVSPAAAQVRMVPVEIGAPAVGVPSALSGSPLPSASIEVSPSLLVSPSLSPSFNPSPLVPSALDLSHQAEATSVAASKVYAPSFKAAFAVQATRPNFPSKSASVAAVVPTALSQTLNAALVSQNDLDKPANPETALKLNALFDGLRERSNLAASVSDDDGPRGDAPRARKPLLSAKTKKRAITVAAVAVPIAVASAVLGAAAPALALHLLHWIGQGAYWLANPFAFAFTLPQIYKMLRGRSAEVSKSMLAVGFLSTVAMSLNMAYDGKDLMLYRNLAQAAGFGVMLFLQRRFAKRPDGPLPSKRKAALETAGAVLVMAAALALVGPALVAAIPGVALMGSLLVPFQVVSGFGFTYLMYAQLTKMQRERSTGDSSPAMMWAYLGTKTIWLWSMATMMSLATGPAWMILSLGTLFVGLTWFSGIAALSRLLHAPYSFLPEKLSFAGRTLPKSALADAVAFVALSALILALAGAGWLAFDAFLGVPAADGSRFLMYLLYTVQSLVACLATLRTLRMHREFDKG